MAEVRCRLKDDCADFPQKCERCIRNIPKKSYFVDRELAEQHQRMHLSPRGFRLRILDDIFEFFED